MDLQKLTEMYGMIQRIDERTDSMVKRLDSQDQKIADLQKTQTKHSVYVGAGASIMSVVLQKIFNITLAAMLVLFTSGSTNDVQTGRHKPTAAIVQTTGRVHIERAQISGP